MSAEPSWVEAERLSGKRLDRRKRYFVDDGQVYSLVRFTTGCSGCWNGDVYSPDYCGCDECGHTGKRRRIEPVPLLDEDIIQAS